MQVQIANRTRSKLPLRDTPLPLLEGIYNVIDMIQKVTLSFSAALDIPEVMPTVDQQSEGTDKEWQTWLQELFCCGKLVCKGII